MCSLKDFENLVLDESHRAYLKDELELWHRFYLPIDTTKAQLDIGAGNGETAQFYLNHGASHVICIEPDANLLYKNFGDDSRVTIIPVAVSGGKIDIEGWELNMIIETHNSYAIRKVFRFDRTIWKIVRVKLALRTRAQYLWRLTRR